MPSSHNVAHNVAMIRWFAFSFSVAMVLAGVLIGSRPKTGDYHQEILGSGRAYAILGELPLMHGGREKPLDTVAIEVVELIHGRSTIKLFDSPHKMVFQWKPVAAVLDWSARAEFWDDQNFILVDHPLLNRLLLQSSIRAQIRSISSMEEPASKSRLQMLIDQPALTEVELSTLARDLGEQSKAAKSLKALAKKLGEDGKWLSPNAIENSQLQLEGRTLTLLQWNDEILAKQEGNRSAGEGVALKLTPIEVKVIEVAERFIHYKAIREHDSPALKSLDLLVTPRPSNGNYLIYSREVFEKGMKPNQSFSSLESNVANFLVEFLESRASRDWALPGEDAAFDLEFEFWASQKSRWIPLGVILNSDESELSKAGLPLAQVQSLRTSYRLIEAAERAEPGNIPEAFAVDVIAAARDLGEGLGKYPKSATMAIERHLNRFSPFSKVPMAYGFGSMFLLLSLGSSVSLSTATRKLGFVLYGLGIAGLLTGITLELYGFFQRFRISHCIPITTIHETVFLFALATSIVGLTIEILWWEKKSALTASGIALLATALAETLPFFDPHFEAALPVLRRNYWLLGHVLMTVSSYGAFALALGFGLLAMGHYITASYHRSPTFHGLAWPLLPGVPLYVLGHIGMGSPLPLLPRSILHSPQLDYVTQLDYVNWGLASVGGVLSIVGGLSLVGELVNRFPRRAGFLGVIVIAIGLTELIFDSISNIHGPLLNHFTSYTGGIVFLIGVALTVMSLLAVQSRSDITRIQTLCKFITRSMLVGVVFLTAGIVTGSCWAFYKWGGYVCWHWDPKEVFALTTLLVYLMPLHGRFAGWISPFGLAVASVTCFTSVMISWYGLNFVFRIGLHHYAFSGGGDQRILVACVFAPLAVGCAAAWRRWHSQ